MDRLLELEVYVQVVHAGSFTAAGRDLGLSPSAVSKQIGRLEDRLGVRLLNRTTRKVAMTEEGAAFFEHAKRIIADLDEAEQALSHLRAAPRELQRDRAPDTAARPGHHRHASFNLSHRLLRRRIAIALRMGALYLPLSHAGTGP